MLMFFLGLFFQNLDFLNRGLFLRPDCGLFCPFCEHFVSIFPSCFTKFFPLVKHLTAFLYKIRKKHTITEILRISLTP